MCQVRAFNCSHASLTSNETLALLRNLPNTNRALYEQLMYQKELGLDNNEEPAFASDGVELDDMDIPTDVLIDHLVSDGTVLENGYAVGKDGSLVRNNLAEHIDGPNHDGIDGGEDITAAEEPVFLGRGH
ncbi:hypothetical protein JOM56_014289 [Amanita muscaria]